MNSKQVLDLIKHPEKLQKAEAEELQRALEEYPYSGVLHALYLKALKNQNNYLYPKQLKRTAIAVPDRKVLYYWAEGEVAVPEEETPRIVFKVAEKPEVKPEKVAVKPEPKPEPVKEEKPVEVSPPVVDPEKQPVKEVAKPVIAEKPKAETPARAEINLDNLPASVRETVLRARRVREQFGKKYEDEQPAEQTLPEPPAPKPQVITPQPEPAKPVAEPVKEPQPEIQETPQVAEQVIEEKVTVAPEPVVVPEQIVEPEPEVVEAPNIEEPVAQEPPKAEPIQPAAVKAKEKHSFLDWLGGGDFEEPEEQEKTSESEPEAISQPEKQPEPPLEERPSTEQVQVLYEQFMEKKPKPKLDFKAQDAIDTASLGTSDYAHYITETLAQIYVKQKLYDRAINAYEILRLKYPEKSSFFAARISEIKQLLNENN